MMIKFSVIKIISILLNTSPTGWWHISGPLWKNEKNPFADSFPTIRSVKMNLVGIVVSDFE